MSEPAPKPLEYEQAAATIQQRQYRRLMALTLLNTALLAGYIVGPSIGPFLRGQWNAYQEKRERNRAAARARAILEAAKSYSEPAERVIYEERPEEASKLLGVPPGNLPPPSSNYSTIRDVRGGIYFTPHPWQPPVSFNQPTLQDLRDARLPGPVVFLHTRDNGSGGKPLVGVVLGMHQATDSASPIRDLNHERRYGVTTSRVLVGYCLVNEKETVRGTELRVDRDVPRSTIVWWRKEDQDWEHGQVEFNTRGLFRIYAGQIDPADAAHFTIDYELDGVRGTIDGRLRSDNRVELLPRGGTIVDRDTRGRFLVWDPFISPTTQPRSP